MLRLGGQALVSIANAEDVLHAIAFLQYIDEALDHIVQARAEASAGDDRCPG